MTAFTRGSRSAAVVAFTLLGGAVFSVSCSGPPPAREITLEERIREDKRIGDEIAVDFESRVNLRKDVDVQVFLRNLASKLAEGSEELRAAPLGVFLLQDGAGFWRSYALPGNRVYLSVSVLRRIEFENELAGAIAYELANILNRHAMQKLLGDANVPGERTGERKGDLIEGVPAVVKGRIGGRPDYFGESGVFAFTDENRLASAETAVSLMYRAGYDPRGLVSLWNRYREFGEKSPYDPAILTKLTEKTREAIAYFAPLRNPVVRSEAFLLMKRRIERL